MVKNLKKGGRVDEVKREDEDVSTTRRFIKAFKKIAVNFKPENLKQ